MTVPMIAVHQPLSPIACMDFAAMTEEKTSTDPTDRSIPEVMMTKVIPTAMTAQIETFWAMFTRLLYARNRLTAPGPRRPRR